MFDYAQEAYNSFVNELTHLQDTGSKWEYKQFAMEALSERATKARLIEILYKDMTELTKAASYKEIDETKGDFTKFKYYETFASSLETLNKLYKGDVSNHTLVKQDLDDLNKLHTIIINMRSDFEYGYKMNIDLIMNMYNTMVLSALEYINVCTVVYVKYLRNPEARDIKGEFKPECIQRNIRYIIRAYEKGDISKVMKEFKKNSKNFTGTGILYAGVTLLSIITSAVIAGVVIVGLISAIRELIYLFYSTSYNISEWSKVQNAVLKETMTHESNEVALKRQQKLSTALSKASDFVEHNIMFREKKAKEKIKKSNKDKLKKSNLEVAPEFDRTAAIVADARRSTPEVEKDTNVGDDNATPTPMLDPDNLPEGSTMVIF